MRSLRFYTYNKCCLWYNAWCARIITQ